MIRFFLLLLLLPATTTVAAEPLDFNRDILPILSDNCFHCHGPDAKQREADLRLDTREGLFRNQDETIVVAPGKPAMSALIERIRSSDDDLRMPPPDSQRSLSDEQIAKLTQWVAQGAVWNGHWSFQTIRRPDVPNVQGKFADWPRNPIDQFLLVRMQADGFAPQSVAERSRLLRRVTLDLTGLPPDAEETERFLADTRPGAYERVVDRLLASPRYGERMAWDWMDAARYADSNGYQGDRERTMWPWRDWVVQAFNENLGYDQFTIQQLAGDLLPESSPEHQLATGFCRNHMINGEGGRIAEENRIEYIFDQIETVGTVWLGLTVTCCRCHDHKFDPLQQREYYQLFAFFNQTPVNGGGGDPQTAPVIDVPSDEQQQELVATQRQTEEAAVAVDRFELAYFTREPGQPVSAAEQAKGLDAKLLKILQTAASARDSNQLRDLEKQFGKSSSDYGALLAQQREAIDRQAAIRSSIPRVMVMQDGNPRETHILDKGLYNQPGETVSAQLPQAIGPRLSPESPVDRLALARWLVDPRHPLTARVTVNRYWQSLFGTGLVKTTEDFGSQGERPFHPELLDWLAAEFIESGWDVKRLQRLLVTSAAYRQSAKAPAADWERDPENRRLARGPRHRLPAWMLRDQALAVSGLLVRKQGGPPVKPYQPEGVWAEATFGKKKYVPDTGERLYRRSMYTFWRRIVGPTMFFDAAKRQTCSVKVTTTNTPLHALVTLNDVTFVEAARVMAEGLLQAERISDEQRLQLAFRSATSRQPLAAETQRLLARLAFLRTEFAAAPDETQGLLAVGAAPRDSALDPVEHAAWTSLCLLLLNLDETLSK